MTGICLLEITWSTVHLHVDVMVAEGFAWGGLVQGIGGTAFGIPSSDCWFFLRPCAASRSLLWPPNCWLGCNVERKILCVLYLVLKKTIPSVEKEWLVISLAFAGRGNGRKCGVPHTLTNHLGSRAPVISFLWLGDFCPCPSCSGRQHLWALSPACPASPHPSSLQLACLGPWILGL